MPILSEERRAELARIYTATNTQIKELTATLEAVKTELRDGLEHGDTYTAGDHSIQVTPNRAFDKDSFAARYPVSEATAHLYKAEPNLEAIREHLAPIDVEEFMTEAGKARVVVK